MNTRHTKSYRCFAPNCGKSDKDWPRLDNFKQHLSRMHPELDMEDLLRQLVLPPRCGIEANICRSNEWFDGQTGPLDFEESVSRVLHSQEDTVRSETQRKKRSREDDTPAEEPPPKKPTLGLQTQITQDTGFLPPQSPHFLSPNSAVMQRNPSFQSNAGQGAFTGWATPITFNSGQGAMRSSQMQPQAQTQPQQRSPYAGARRSTVAQPPTQNNARVQTNYYMPPNGFNFSGSMQPQNGARSLYEQQHPQAPMPQMHQSRPYTAPDPNTDFSEVRRAFIQETNPLPFAAEEGDFAQLMGIGSGPTMQHSSPATSQEPHTPNHLKLGPDVSIVSETDDDGDFDFNADDLANELKSFVRQHGISREQRQTMLSAKGFGQMLQTWYQSSSSASKSEADRSGKSGPARSGKRNYICPHTGCRKLHARGSDLKKHLKRHDRPYGCTHDDCYKKFGSKGDLKRHEKTHPEQRECYRCDGSHIMQGGRPCYQVWYNGRDGYKNHLFENFGRDAQLVDMKADSCHIPQNNQGGFWCGFCNAVVKGEAIHRLTHIEEHVFKQNQMVSEWIELSGDGRKKSEMEAIQRGRSAGQNASQSSSDTSSSSPSEGDSPSQRSIAQPAARAGVAQPRQPQTRPQQSQMQAQMHAQMNFHHLQQQHYQIQHGMPMQRSVSFDHQIQQRQSQRDPANPRFNRQGQLLATHGKCCRCKTRYLLDLYESCTSCGHDLCSMCKKVAPKVPDDVMGR
jgi:hypothetical protein